MRTPEELRGASKALYYELLMLDATARALSPRTTHEPHVGNAILESFLVHARNLIDFLYLPKGGADDILAGDFFEKHDDWRRLRPKESAALKVAKKKMNKLLAHLTYSRLKTGETDSKWDIMGLRSEIVSRMAVFVDNVAAHIIDTTLADLMCACRHGVSAH
ncbi:MAG: hypothetical protein JW993_15085 [Sedimentisphaerales bacterium]|nr:hypothetical protein [Sedimentisphaerales bacterium]